MCPRCTLGLPVLGAHAKMPPLRHFAAERCESGRFGVPGEHVCWQRHRGFESHPLRHHVQGPYSHSVELVDAKKPMQEGGIRTGVLKGVRPPPSPPAFAKASAGKPSKVLAKAADDTLTCWASWKALAGRPAEASRKVVKSLSPVCRFRLDDGRTFRLANARRGWALCNRIL